MGLCKVTILGSCIVLAVWLFSPVRAAERGATFRDCAECPEMTVIRGGTFLMG
jgi:hypothetical protein